MSIRNYLLNLRDVIRLEIDNLLIVKINAIERSDFMSLFWAHTPMFKDAAGKRLPESIAEMGMVAIGGVEQWILIRGENRNNPVLLLLHGGPGSPETGLFRHFNHELEKHFVVVNWDQRGCGKSYSKEMAKAELSVDMYVEDICELTKYLMKKLQKEKVFLFGHSWGTMIGTLAIHKHPELFYAYVGTGQCSDMPKSELRSYQYALEQAEKYKHKKAIAELTKIGEPKNGDYTGGIAGISIQRKWLMYFKGAVHGSKSLGRFIKVILTSKEYNLSDCWKFLKGMNAPSRNRLSQSGLLKTNLFDIVKEVKVPVYFFLGRHDYQVPSSVSEEYFHFLKAPKKTLEWFEDSAHLACFEEPEKFNRLMVEKVLAENWPNSTEI